MNLLGKSIESIFKVNLGVEKGESVLVLVDRNKKNLGRRFLEIGRGFSGNIDMIEIPLGNVNGQEPPKEIAKKMLDYDVLLLLTTYSLSHTKARRNASKRGIRIASMPDITRSILRRALDVDYKKMHKRIGMIADAVDKGKSIRLISRLGTDITFSIKGRKTHGRTGGMLREKGKFGNLPCGEAFIAPVEGTAEGVYVIDGSIGGIGQVDAPVRVEVRKGMAVKIKGKKSAKSFSGFLDKVKGKTGNIAEFGIGANDKAKIIGNMLEDEKVMGTCHIAVGDNSGFGGKVAVALHMDGLIKKPTVFVDGKKIMERGKLLLS